MDADTQLPAEHLAPLPAQVDRVLALYGYELAPAIDAIDSAVPGCGGLFDPATSPGELRTALDDVVAAGAPAAERPSLPDTPPERLVLYVDGSSRGNPGPAGAGAVLLVDGDPLARLGRPVGSHTGNNVAEYAALQLGLTAVAACDPRSLEARIDSMTVVDDVWRGGTPAEAHATYSDAVAGLLADLAHHDWQHLADSDPNPADARATVGADIAALGG